MAGSANGVRRDDVLAYAKQQFQTVPEYLWKNSPESAVLRHGNKKWYAIIMRVSADRFGGNAGESVDIVNVKCDPLMLGSMLMQEGFFPAYHMNKNSWISILLDGSVPQSQVYAALKMSYTLVSTKSGKAPRTEPKSWLIPANPKYEDISKTFREKSEIFWKQSGKFIPGDMIYIYEGKPIGAVTFACEVAEINIPYHYNQGGLHMEIVMRMLLRKRYARTNFPLERLRDYGVSSVRGPRGIPEELLAALQREGEA